MTNSVNTNYGAMVALQNLNKTNMQLQTTQNRINTGLQVANAKDNGGIYAIAQRMRSDVSAYGVVQDSLNRGISTTDVTLAAGEAISDLLIEMKEKALAAGDTSLDTPSRVALNEDFKALRDQIATIVENAEFNGLNLIDGSATDGFIALANADGSKTITVGTENLSLSGTIVTLSSTASFGTATAASDIASQIATSLENVNSALARLGTKSKALEIHQTFVTKLSDALESGIGNLVDADMAKESAKLQSLQVKQQLGIQALSIANSAPQSVLSFFR
ncbi:flagellin domain-containing protein [Glycocaulis alkaliphilus]|uniref:Flagellin n=1 Tax=Glycocaulis alkaliphilus TaxID=1434191 RepID=A0A3T0EBM4_9PROT|nr:flagellin [Glycocaulis alkaliphilus]AZU04722.1 flagellin domain-containing protein [Glycocaulis alkaliphilus]GGB68189.1 flagellin [Glycocaulis alkaliphilus]